MGPEVRRLHFDIIDSTNAEALRRAAQGERGPLWIDADLQQAGRGRNGRSWQSLPGNLMSSVLFSTTAPLMNLAQVSLVAGVAVLDALRMHKAATTPASCLSLKWPNDILLEGKKAGGILVESSTAGAITTVVIGIGLNTNAAPELENAATADLSDVLAEGIDLPVVRAALADRFAYWIDIWAEGTGFPEVRERWMADGPTRGSALEVRQGETLKRGRYAGLDASGALCLEHADGTSERVLVGDVSLGSGSGR